MRFLLIAVLVLSCSPLFSDGVGTETIDGHTWLYWNVGNESSIASEWSSWDCPTRDSLDIPATLGGATVTSIRDGAFSNRAEIKAVKIPTSIRRIGQSAFSGCSSLRTVVASNTIESIGFAAFSSCDALQDDSRMIIVGDWLCGYGGNDHDIAIPKDVRNISDYALNCDSLRTIRLHADVKSIGVGAFSGCCSLNSIEVDPNNLWYSSHEGALYDKGMSVLIFFPVDAEEARILPTVLRLDTMFHECHQLRRFLVEDLNTAYSSRDGILYDKSGTILLRCPRGVTEAVVLKGPETVGEFAFMECERLKAVVIPEGVSTLKSAVFQGCTALRHVQLPSTLVKIQELAFDRCCDLTTISVCAENNVYKSIGGVLYDKSGAVLTVCPAGRRICEVSTGTTEIGYPAFYNCSKLTAISLPKTLVKIHSGSFSLCNELRTIYVEPGDVERVSDLLRSHFYNFDQISVKESAGVQVDDNLTIREIWTKSFNGFSDVYGEDLADALKKPSGKCDGAGNEMLVWQDFVVGTDPTDPDDKFTASIVISNGIPVITHTPVLSVDEEAMRTYKTFAKANLRDVEWVDITNLTDEKRKSYSYFKVTVEMKR